jgi:simple sugar transport system ATP-binding protein
LTTAIEMRNIVRQFPGVLANDHISLTVEAGEIHGLLGDWRFQTQARSC